MRSNSEVPAMVKGSKSVFSGEMADWTPIEPRRKATDRAPAKPDRVARELNVVQDKYVPDAPRSDKAKNGGHSKLIRAKKKDALDDETGAKTFVVQNNKIVGSQG